MWLLLPARPSRVLNHFKQHGAVGQRDMAPTGECFRAFAKGIQRNRKPASYNDNGTGRGNNAVKSTSAEGSCLLVFVPSMATPTFIEMSAVISLLNNLPLQFIEGSPAFIFPLDPAV